MGDIQGQFAKHGGGADDALDGGEAAVNGVGTEPGVLSHLDPPGPEAMRLAAVAVFAPAVAQIEVATL